MKRVIAKIRIFIFVDSFAFVMGLLSDLEKNVPRTGVIFLLSQSVHTLDT